MAEKYKVIITPEAQDDIRSSVMYIARELANPKAAIALQEEFRKEISHLQWEGRLPRLRRQGCHRFRDGFHGRHRNHLRGLRRLALRARGLGLHPHRGDGRDAEHRAGDGPVGPARIRLLQGHGH